jgi:hypothetical protein
MYQHHLRALGGPVAPNIVVVTARFSMLLVDDASVHVRCFRLREDAESTKILHMTALSRFVLATSRLRL